MEERYSWSLERFCLLTLRNRRYSGCSSRGRGKLWLRLTYRQMVRHHQQPWSLYSAFTACTASIVLPSKTLEMTLKGSFLFRNLAYANEWAIDQLCDLSRFFPTSTILCFLSHRMRMIIITCLLGAEVIQCMWLLVRAQKILSFRLIIIHVGWQLWMKRAD